MNPRTAQRRYDRRSPVMPSDEQGPIGCSVCAQSFHTKVTILPEEIAIVISNAEAYADFDIQTLTLELRLGKNTWFVPLNELVDPSTMSGTVELSGIEVPEELPVAAGLAAFTVLEGSETFEDACDLFDLR
ncbi:MAG: hypothetical protein RIT81_08690 [Deltaproteobacteria bacterium]